MRKKCLYVLFGFVSMIFSITSVDALECRYAHPDFPNDTSKDIVIEFNDTAKNEAFLKNEKRTTCITSSIGKINLRDTTDYYYNYTSYYDRNWTFDKEQFDGISCLSMTRNENEELGDSRICPALGYTKIDSVYHIVNINKKIFCQNSDKCVNLVIRDNSQSPGNDDETKTKTCNYTFDLTNISKARTKINVAIKESPKGTFWVSVNGSEYEKINSSSDLFAFDISTKDLLSVALKKEHLSNFILLDNPDEATDLVCKSSKSYIYYDRSYQRYIIVPAKDDIPSGVAFGEGYIYGSKEPGGSVKDIDICNDLVMVWTIFGYIIYAIQIVIPLLLIISGMITMVRTLFEKEESKFKNAQNLLVKKVVAAVIAFLVISVVKIVVSLVTTGDWETCVKCSMHPFENGCGIIKGEN